MAPYYIPLERYRTKFYQKEVGSKKFLSLSEEQMAEVAKKVYKRQEIDADIPLCGTVRKPKLERYENTLQYLTNPLIHLELGSFDERMGYLIMITDPELTMFKDFLKLNLISKAEIAKVKDIKERTHLQFLRDRTLAEFEKMIRERLGFYDPKLLKYEELYFRRYFGDKELITEVGTNNPDYLMARAKALPNFDSISDERYNELVEFAATWKAIVPEQYNCSTALYNITEQKKLLGLRSIDEQLAMFVLLADSELDMLRIYEEESRMPIVESRIVEQFGYYNPELLTLEKKFHKRFCPEKELSIWTKVKKD